MKHKQNGSVHIILLSIMIVLIGGVLTYALLKNIDSKADVAHNQISTSESEDVASLKNIANKPDAASDQITPPKSTKADNNTQGQAFAEFSDFKVRFPTSVKYTLKRNSGTGNMAGYWISIDSLAQTCTTPDSPWLGFLGQHTPSDVIPVGPDAGKTHEQVFGSHGKTIEGKLYVFNVMTQFCTRNEPNPAVEQAAEKLKSEIEHLEAY